MMKGVRTASLASEKGVSPEAPSPRRPRESRGRGGGGGGRGGERARSGGGRGGGGGGGPSFSSPRRGRASAPTSSVSPLTPAAPLYDHDRNPAYQVVFSHSTIGKHVHLTKRRVSFRFGYSDRAALDRGASGPDARGQEHVVELLWSVLSGNVGLTFDGREVRGAQVVVQGSTKVVATWEMGGRMTATTTTAVAPTASSSAGSGVGGGGGDGGARHTRHLFRVVAHLNPVGGAAVTAHPGKGNRQYDLFLDGRSFFDLPEIYMLGTFPGGRGRRGGGGRRGGEARERPGRKRGDPDPRGRRDEEGRRSAPPAASAEAAPASPRESPPSDRTRARDQDGDPAYDGLFAPDDVGGSASRESFDDAADHEEQFDDATPAVHGSYSFGSGSVSRESVGGGSSPRRTVASPLPVVDDPFSSVLLPGFDEPPPPGSPSPQVPTAAPASAIPATMAVASPNSTNSPTAALAAPPPLPQTLPPTTPAPPASPPAALPAPTPPLARTQEKPKSSAVGGGRSGGKRAGGGGGMSLSDMMNLSKAGHVRELKEREKKIAASSKAKEERPKKAEVAKAAVSKGASREVKKEAPPQKIAAVVAPAKATEEAKEKTPPPILPREEEVAPTPPAPVSNDAENDEEGETEEERPASAKGKTPPTPPPEKEGANSASASPAADEARRRAFGGDGRLPPQDPAERESVQLRRVSPPLSPADPSDLDQNDFDRPEHGLVLPAPREGKKASAYIDQSWLPPPSNKDKKVSADINQSWLRPVPKKSPKRAPPAEPTDESYLLNHAKCALCCRDASDVMVDCQCGRPCGRRAHAACLMGGNRSNPVPSVSHPCTPAPVLPTVLCGGIFATR